MTDLRKKALLGGALSASLLASLQLVGGAGALAAPPKATSARAVHPAVFRSGLWYFRDTLTTGDADSAFRYGNRTDIPVTGDWNGDGARTIGVYRAGFWYLRNSNTTGPADVTLHYGDRGDTPVVGDWDGNGSFTPGVVRGNVWYLRNSNTSGIADVVFRFGDQGDIPMVGDWDGNGTYTPGVYRPSKNPDAVNCVAADGPCYVSDPTWYLRNSNSSGAAFTHFASGYPVAPADWDGDGTTTAGFMDDHARWGVYTHTNGSLDHWFTFGDRGDKPLVWS